MTGGAIGTQSSFVLIIGAMARGAARIEFFTLYFALVAGHAGEIGVSAVQRKFGLRGVIERWLAPRFRGMAIVTLGPVAPLVRVVTAMAGNAFLARRFPEVRTRMARQALETGMSGSQGKAGFLQVIENLLFPRNGIVASAAVSAALPMMRIVDPMTCHAGRGRLPVALSGMTQHALDRPVSAGQRVARVLAMVEAGVFP